MRVLVFTALLMWLGGSVQADSTWSDPHPQRREALLQGRDFRYNVESFLHRLSYRHLSDRPAPGDDGVYGTGGSVTGDELYVDINLQKTLIFDDERHAFIARMQRREDFDGHFDRQLVGIARRLGEQWRVAMLSDAAADKADLDMQLEARWQPDERRRLRLAVVFTDPIFDQSTKTDDRYRGDARTLFAHYRHEFPGGAEVEAAVNVSPEATFDSASTGVTAGSEQQRLMFAASTAPFRGWRTGLRAEAERTDRSFNFDRFAPPAAETFERRMHRLRWTVAALELPLTPQAGLQYFRLDERGWFGDGLASSGTNRRREVAAFAGVTLRTGARHRLEPTVYVSHTDYRRDFVERPGLDRDERRWIGKLALPWRYTVNAESGATITLNPTLRLHTAAFGGGNIQFHWPL